MSISLSDLLTLLVALYGAMLSTILALREFKREKRQIRVTCRMTLGSALTGDVLEFVQIHVVNTGHRPIQITSAALELSDGNQFIQLTSKLGPLSLPKKIDDHESVSVYFDYPDVEKALKEREDPDVIYTSAVVRDAEGNEYRSKLPRVLKDRGLAK